VDETLEMQDHLPSPSTAPITVAMLRPIAAAGQALHTSTEECHQWSLSCNAFMMARAFVI
jgi:hypothetical protein